MAHGQLIRSCGRPSPLSYQGGGVPVGSTNPPILGTSSFNVVPSLCVSERYDTNVFYAPPTPGLQREDFVTNVNPMLRISHNGDYASGFLNIGGFGETYIRNPDINYLGTNDLLSLNLDNSIKRLLPNATLRIVDYFSYTPLPPGFVNPTAGTSPSDPANIQNVFAQGFLGIRTNNLINSGTVSTSYATTASTSLIASYNYSILRFMGTPTVQGNRGLFDTTSQTGIVGGVAQLSGVDTVNVKFAHGQTEFVSATSSSLFKITSATVGWSRILTPNISAELGGGGIVINPGITTYAANAALIMNSLNNSATLSYSRSAFPSFAGSGEPLVGNVFSLSAFQKIDRQWELVETANYSDSSGGSGINAVAFNSYSGSVDLHYWITRIWSTALSYDYMKFHTESGSFTSDFDRHAITISIRATGS